MLPKIKRGVFFTAIFMVLLSAAPGRVGQAFRAMDVFDYFKAKELFEKSLKSETVPAAYGLSILYARDKNPFHNPDSAYKYAKIAEDGYRGLSEKKKTSVETDYGVTAESIEAQKQLIGALFFQNALKESTIGALKNFIDEHTYSRDMPRAIRAYDSLGYRKALKENTWQSYKEFTDTHPGSVQFAEANRRYDTLLYADKTRDGKAESYARFAAEYPHNPYAAEALDRSYRVSTQSSSVADFEQFIRNYPKNPNVNKAWESLYKLYFTDFSDAQVDAFLKKYKDFPLRSMLAQDVKAAKEPYLPIEKNRLYGFADREGNVIIHPEYDFVDSFSNGLVLAGKGEKVGYLDTRGQTAVPFVYDDGSKFDRGLAVVFKGDLAGVINKLGDEVVPVKFEEVKIGDGRISAEDTEGKIVYYDSRGQKLPGIYLYGEPFRSGRAIVKDTTGYSVIDTTGRRILSGRYQGLKYATDSTLFAADSTGKWKLIDLEEKPLSKAYDAVGPFSEGLAWVSAGDKYGYLDDKGTLVIPANLYLYKNMKQADFKGGVALTSYRNKYGLITRSGKKVVPNIMDDLIPVSDFPVPVRKGSKWGFVNQNVGMQVPAIYDAALPFGDNVAAVAKAGKWGLINPTGKTVLPFEYSSIENVGNNVLLVAKEGKMGAMGIDGKMILPIEYDRVRLFADHILQIINGDTFWYYDLLKEDFIYKGN